MLIYLLLDVNERFLFQGINLCLSACFIRLPSSFCLPFSLFLSSFLSLLLSSSWSIPSCYINPSNRVRQSTKGWKREVHLSSYIWKGCTVWIFSNELKPIWMSQNFKRKEQIGTKEKLVYLNHQTANYMSCRSQSLEGKCQGVVWDFMINTFHQQ